MMQNEKLALAIGEVGWSKFKSKLEYKAEWYGKNIVYIGRFEPSSKMCSHCGAINKELRLKDRSWTSKTCGTDHDRDLNAAINIKNTGLRNRPSTVNVSQDERPCVWVEN
jgi:putative transposase